MATADNNNSEPRELAVEELNSDAAAAETSAASVPAPAKANRRGLVLGGSIAAGIAALALSFGGGYALGHERGGPDDRFAGGQQGQFGERHGGDGDGDHFGGDQGQFAPGGDQGQLGGNTGPGQGQQTPPQPGATTAPTAPSS